MSKKFFSQNKFTYILTAIGFLTFSGVTKAAYEYNAPNISMQTYTQIVCEGINTVAPTMTVNEMLINRGIIQSDTQQTPVISFLRRPSQGGNIKVSN